MGPSNLGGHDGKRGHHHPAASPPGAQGFCDRKASTQAHRSPRSQCPMTSTPMPCTVGGNWLVAMSRWLPAHLASPCHCRGHRAMALRRRPDHALAPLGPAHTLGMVVRSAVRQGTAPRVVDAALSTHGLQQPRLLQSAADCRSAHPPSRTAAGCGAHASRVLLGTDVIQHLEGSPGPRWEAHWGSIRLPRASMTCLPSSLVNATR